MAPVSDPASDPAIDLHLKKIKEDLFRPTTGNGGVDGAGRLQASWENTANRNKNIFKYMQLQKLSLFTQYTMAYGSIGASRRVLELDLCLLELDRCCVELDRCFEMDVPEGSTPLLLLLF